MTHKIKLSAVAGAVVLALGATSAMAAAPNKIYGAQEFQVNIIGMDTKLTSKLKNSYRDNGKRMFVQLNGKTSILLQEGDYGVIDADGTDGEASFQLPNPDTNHDGITEYTVFARALGKPGGEAKVRTCADVTDTDGYTTYTWCDTEGEVYLRSTKGKRTWDNVTRELLYIEYDFDLDGKVELIPLFDDRLANEFWEYDNNGLRLAQLRFYNTEWDVCKDAGGLVDSNGYCQLP